MLVILPVLGGVVAAVVALVAGGLLTLGRDATGFAGPLRLAGYLTLFLAPFAGVPVAAALVRRLVRWRLDTGGIALVVLGGMTGCALSVALPLAPLTLSFRPVTPIGRSEGPGCAPPRPRGGDGARGKHPVA